MGEENGPTAVNGSKRKVSGALVALLVAIVALGAAFFAFGGPTMVANLISGTSASKTASTIPAKPATGSAAATGTASGSTAASASASSESSATTASGSTASSGGSATTKSTTTATTKTSATPSTGTGVTPPTGDQASRMFWEQVASQQQIGELVAGRIGSVSINAISKTASVATLGVTVRYTNGSSLSGTMVLRSYGGTWYFSSIQRSGGSGQLVHSIPADTAVVRTIVEETASNQYIPLGLINGGYKTCTISHVTSGSGTATLGVTLSGGSAARSAGQIVCISKNIAGAKYWFITSFQKR